MNNTTQMFSKREQRWVDAMPMPYPPFWWEYIGHFFRCLLVLGKQEAKKCRVCDQQLYQLFSDYHSAMPATDATNSNTGSEEQR